MGFLNTLSSFASTLKTPLKIGIGSLRRGLHATGRHITSLKSHIEDLYHLALHIPALSSVVEELSQTHLVAHGKNFLDKVEQGIHLADDVLDVGEQFLEGGSPNLEPIFQNPLIQSLA